jgi:hypothetical protein
MWKLGAPENMMVLELFSSIALTVWLHKIVAKESISLWHQHRSLQGRARRLKAYHHGLPEPLDMIACV